MKIKLLSRAWLGVLGVLTASAGYTAGQTWPQWHGPHRDNVSTETGLLKQWPEGGPKLLWTATGCGKKLLAGQKLSPLLLVRDTKNARVIIADGYHRMCAVYSCDEDTVVPCKIV